MNVAGGDGSDSGITVKLVGGRGAGGGLLNVKIPGEEEAILAIEVIEEPQHVLVVEVEFRMYRYRHSMIWAGVKAG